MPEVVAVQAEGAPAMVESWRSGKLVVSERAQTIADGIAVRLDVAPEALVKIGSQNKVVPGMQTDVFIRTGQRTFLGYLMQPLSDSFRRAWRER